MLDFILIRVFFVAVLAAGAAFFRPEDFAGWQAALAGALLGAIAILAERRLDRVNLKKLIGMAAGTLVGTGCAVLIGIGLNQAGASSEMHLVALACLVVFAWLGASLGSSKGALLDLSVFGGAVATDAESRGGHKILDTSVIIDGRIADIAETGFLDGVLIVPQFVLHELQMVADSADSMRRNRGRRGLDVLQRLQKMPNLKVQISQEDFPEVREVDMKLIELAHLRGGRIVTNDFNLNKVAHVRGVEVLNINELANSLKPIVLPGELMRVFILKEGKEYNQGVAYLDDGTMVVVDNARRMISKTIDISVTSVLQTTAGKMIFGKYDERSQPVAQVAAAAVSNPALERREPPQRRQQAVGES